MDRQLFIRILFFKKNYNNTIKESAFSKLCPEYLGQFWAHSLSYIVAKDCFAVLDWFFCTTIVQDTDSASAIDDFLQAKVVAQRLSQHADK